MTITDFIILYPRTSIIVIALAISFIMTIAFKYLTDQTRMKELKELQKACNIKLKDNRGNPEKLAEIQKEMMSYSFELIKHSFKPMIFTLIPFLILFWWLRHTYAVTEIAKTWFWYYLGAALISGPIFRKILKVV